RTNGAHAYLDTVIPPKPCESFFPPTRTAPCSGVWAAVSIKRCFPIGQRRRGSSDRTRVMRSRGNISFAIKDDSAGAAIEREWVITLRRGGAPDGRCKRPVRSPVAV